MKTLLILLVLFCCSRVLGQINTYALTRKIEIDNLLLLKELKKNLNIEEKNVYLFSVNKEKGYNIVTLQSVGYISEIKNNPASLYTIVNDNILLIRTGFEELTENKAFFERTVRPLVKNKLIDDLLPNGNINTETLPYAGYDPIDIVITLKGNKIYTLKKAR